MYDFSKRTQTEIRKYIKNINWVAPHSVTFTMKQVVQSAAGRPIFLNPDRASQNFRHFLNILNRKVWGKAAARVGKSVRCFCVLEGAADKRLHYHALLDCPREDQLEQFSSIVEDSWKQTDWSYNQLEIQPFCDDGWIKYISKFRDKSDFLSAFDWANCHTG